MSNLDAWCNAVSLTRVVVCSCFQYCPRFKNGTTFVISTPGHLNYVSGEKYKFGFDKNALHFFDGETRERIN